MRCTAPDIPQREVHRGLHRQAIRSRTARDIRTCPRLHDTISPRLNTISSAKAHEQFQHSGLKHRRRVLGWLESSHGERLRNNDEDRETTEAKHR
jgi:hypothetical protein